MNIKSGDTVEVETDWSGKLGRGQVIRVQNNNGEKFAEVLFARDHILKAKKFGTLFSVQHEVKKVV